MAETFTELNPGTGGSKVDMFSLDTLNLRQSLVIGSAITGSNVIEPITVLPPSTTIALPVRQVLTPAANTSHRVLTASTNATVIKASAGTLYRLELSNATTVVFYVKIYDKATTPNPASDTVKKTFQVQVGVPRDIRFDPPLALSAGISFAVVLGISDVDISPLASSGAGIVDSEYT